MIYENCKIYKFSTKDGREYVKVYFPNNTSETILQILNNKKHSSIDRKRIENAKCICAWCGKEFFIEGKKIKDRNRRKSGPFCSKKCIGEYGAELQNKRANIASKKNIERKYFFLEK